MRLTIDGETFEAAEVVRDGDRYVGLDDRGREVWALRGVKAAVEVTDDDGNPAEPGEPEMVELRRRVDAVAALAERADATAQEVAQASRDGKTWRHLD